MDELITMLNDAATTQNWVLLALGVVLLAVPLVLKALGKSVPLLDSAIPIIVDFLKRFKKSPPPEQAPEKQAGVASVVHIDKAREDK